MMSWGHTDSRLAKGTVTIAVVIIFDMIIGGYR
jgi:hypothetical protein